MYAKNEQNVKTVNEEGQWQCHAQPNRSLQQKEMKKVDSAFI